MRGVSSDMRLIAKYEVNRDVSGQRLRAIYLRGGYEMTALRERG